MAKSYFSTEERNIARLDETSDCYRNAEVLRDGKWMKTYPAELLWNANPITRAKAIDILLNWTLDPVTEAEAIQLLDEET